MHPPCLPVSEIPNTHPQLALFDWDFHLFPLNGSPGLRTTTGTVRIALAKGCDPVILHFTIELLSVGNSGHGCLDKPMVIYISICYDPDPTTTDDNPERGRP